MPIPGLLEEHLRRQVENRSAMQPAKPIEMGGLDVSSRKHLALSALQKAINAVKGTQASSEPTAEETITEAIQESVLSPEALAAQAPLEIPTEEPPEIYSVKESADPYGNFKAPKAETPSSASTSPLASGATQAAKDRVPSLKTVPPPSAARRAGNITKSRPPKGGTYDASWDYTEEGADKNASLESLEDILAYVAQKHASARKERDMQLWHTWKSDPNPTTLRPLMKAMEPIAYGEINRWRGNIPDAALEIEAKKLVLDGIKSYKPGRGAALNTHVTNRLKKLSRPVYQHQDAARLPENNKLLTQTYYRGFSQLSDRLGQDPTDEELADHLGWPLKKVHKVQKLSVGEYVESQDLAGDMFSSSTSNDIDPVVHFVYHDLPYKDKLIFEYTTGFGGKRILSAQDVAKKLNMTPSQVSYRKKQIIKKLEGAQR